MTTSTELFPVTTLQPTKPCLKRRSSVPPLSTTNPTIRRQEGSCESLSSSFGSMMSDESTSGSRKSVVFADSVGADLCHVKIFSKELHELPRSNSTHFDETWPARMWQWQQRMEPVAELEEMRTTDEGLWFAGEDDDDYWYDQDEDFDDDDDDDEEPDHFNFDYGQQIVKSVVHEVLQEEDEEDLEEDEEEDERPGSGQQLLPDVDPNTVVTPTFLCPMDLPEYAEQLERLGISLERVSVDDQDTLVTGTIRVHPRIISAFSQGVARSYSPSSSSTMSLFAKISRDSWHTSERVPAYPCPESPEVFEFRFDVGGMQVGDDVELVVEVDLLKDGEPGLIRDDNDGLKYRMICKSKTKFRPGKSLW